MRPAVALVPVGTGNTYGHPSPGLLARLGRGGARVLRTDTDGDLAAVPDGRRLAVARRGVPAGPAVVTAVSSRRLLTIGVDLRLMGN